MSLAIVLFSGNVITTSIDIRSVNMKSGKHDAQLLKLALEIGVGYAKKRGFADFGQGISPKDKVECIYRLLVQDNLIQALSKDKEDGPNMKHKLVLWISRQLPPEHELLN
ncbi:hypothetical protein Shal_0710 [Shewanella halifaxensis HAW-EB4]|uniref:DUF5062 domain-containing protein n=2 Tax=Shewanella halifaxensis TaxID=271098 RepID=B0TSW0_SHEHH|nr:hypothetical protein Shal_0710 [Shewanella halifaxensis HAW-EB4]